MCFFEQGRRNDMQMLRCCFRFGLRSLSKASAKGIHASSCEQHRSVLVAVRIGFCNAGVQKGRCDKPGRTLQWIAYRRVAACRSHCVTTLCSTLLHLCIVDCKAHYQSPCHILVADSVALCSFFSALRRRHGQSKKSGEVFLYMQLK